MAHLDASQAEKDDEHDGEVLRHEEEQQQQHGGGNQHKHDGAGKTDVDVFLLLIILLPSALQRRVDTYLSTGISKKGIKGCIVEGNMSAPIDRCQWCFDPPQVPSSNFVQNAIGGGANSRLAIHTEARQMAIRQNYETRMVRKRPKSL